MIKQTLMFTSPVYLSLKDGQLVITFKDNKDTVTRPIEDIGFVVIEHPEVSISIPALNELADNNVSVIFCDRKKMPKTMLMTLEGNTTQQESYKYQIEASAPTKKNVWKQLVEFKIRNQALLLNKLGKNGDILKQYYMNVKSGDTDNREGAAAREYWGRIFYEGFKREREGLPPNNLLNYGYAILRASVTRAIVAVGLHPAFSLFHHNSEDPTPLANDLMEPWRPIVDIAVYKLYLAEKKDLLPDEKKTLTQVLEWDLELNGQRSPLRVCIQRLCNSFVDICEGSSSSLLFAKIPSIEEIQEEWSEV